MTPLKKARLLSGKRQYDVYREVYIWPGRLSLIENGLVSPRPEEVKALCSLYGIDPKSIYQDPGELQQRDKEGDSH
jgi:transcriptional regulator with XRE-family HTH domain